MNLEQNLPFSWLPLKKGHKNNLQLMLAKSTMRPFKSEQNQFKACGHSRKNPRKHCCSCLQGELDWCNYETKPSTDPQAEQLRLSIFGCSVVQLSSNCDISSIVHHFLIENHSGFSQKNISGYYCSITDIPILSPVIAHPCI